VETKISGDGSDSVTAQAYITPGGRKLLLANQRNREVEFKLPDADKASVLTVDLETGDGPARSVKPVGGSIKLEPFAVTMVSW
jgi:hypothetical protein